MDYLFAKHLHVSCVLLSVALFTLRGVLQLLSKPWRQWRALRMAPHINDTVLLSAALWMVWRSEQYPFVLSWLTAKVLALLAYIVLGHFALSPATPSHQRLPYFLAAMTSVAYIVGVALTRSPGLGWL